MKNETKVRMIFLYNKNEQIKQISVFKFKDAF